MRAWARVAVSLVIVVVAVVAVVAVGASLAGSARGVSGPTVTLDRSEAAPGEPLLVSMSGFEHARAVTIAVCGNLATRGSADCAMSTSEGKEIDGYHDMTLAELVVQAPPMPCPCLVRVTATGGDEFAVAPLVVTGHPVGAIVGPPDADLVSVKVSAARQSGGIVGSVRTALGGKTTYAVTVAVRNITTAPLTSIQLRGVAANRWSDELAKIPLPAVTPLAPGQTWTTTAHVDLPAPVFGEIHWTVAAFGAGPTVESTSSGTVVPWLLYVFIVVFVADLVWLIIRRARQRRGDGSPDDEPDLEAMWDAPAADESELSGVG